MWWLTILSRLPFSVLYLLADVIAFIGYYVVGYRKDVILTNLTNSFPEMAVAGKKKIMKEFYKNLCDYGVETLKLLTLSADELRKRMVYKNPEILRPFVDRKQPVILLASHQFNWEWLLVAGSIELPVPVDFVYQEQSSNLFNQFSLRCRTRFGAYPIKRDNVARESIRRKDIVRGVAVVADQFPGHESDKKYWTQFLNQDTAFFLGIGQLAVLTQYPAFFAAVKKVKRGFYEIELIQISEPPYGRESHVMVDNYAKETEKVIHKNPSGWLWSHKRWKDRA